MDNEGNQYFYCSTPLTQQLPHQSLEEGEIYKPESFPGEGRIDFTQEYEQQYGHPAAGLVDFTQPNSLPGEGFIDFTTGQAQQNGQFNSNPEYSQPQITGLPETNQIERMITNSQRAQIAAGEIELRLQMQQRQQQQQASFDEQPALESYLEGYSDIIQQTRNSQELQDDIQPCLSRLGQARQGIAHQTQRLEQHLQEQQAHERQQRLRARQRHRQRRLQTQHIQRQMQRRGIGIQNQNPNQPSTSTHPNPDFKQIITHLSQKLHPLVSVTTGLQHHHFPKSMLAYNLLTSLQLDELALHFHQTYPPTRASFNYPQPVKPWLVTNGLVRDLGVDLATKRRRFGRFIGLHGCESPTGPEDSANEQEGESVLQTIGWEWERKREVYRAMEDERVRALAAGVRGDVHAGKLLFVHWEPAGYWS
ncbi:uncharacterized protein BDV17DRAFT_292127 [Aspergillus undulatus]|uniref:uncharacterized protein n=1 Tax=Aspergillus undulatus TaxID=1810928 RepID=UPI003CCDDA5E